MVPLMHEVFFGDGRRLNRDYFFGLGAAVLSNSDRSQGFFAPLFASSKNFLKFSSLILSSCNAPDNKSLIAWHSCASASSSAALPSSSTSVRRCSFVLQPLSNGAVPAAGRWYVWNFANTSSTLN